jgi:methionine-rich copper-binding protein CopC
MSRLIGLVALALLSLIILGSGMGLPSALAHAELQSADPAADSVIPALPASMTLTFTEEVKPDGVTVTVTDPDGNRVDDGNAAVDLNNPERNVVNVPLFSGGIGTYQVHWQTVSNLDSDEAEGDYSFTVEASGTSAIGEAVVATPTPNPNANGNPLNPNGNFDSGALGKSVGAGILVALAIFGVWLVVRPKHPKYGSRAEREHDRELDQDLE